MNFRDYLKENSQQYKIFLDLDGVCVNLGKAIKVFGLGSFEEIDAKGIQDELWKRIREAGSDFWRDCPWMKDGQELWKYVKKYNPSILTAPPHSGKEECEKGKREWVKREMGQSVNCIVTVAKLKQQYASPSAVLIDDMQKNIDQWKSAGGIGILHKNTKETIERLKALGL